MNFNKISWSLIVMLFCIIDKGNAQWSSLATGIQYPSGNVYVGPFSSNNDGIGRISASGSIAEVSISNRNINSFVESPSLGERWVIYNSGAVNDGKLRFWTGSDKFILTKEGFLGIGTEVPSSSLSFGMPVKSRMISLHDSPDDWYGLGIQSSQMRFQIGNPTARYSFFAGDNSEIFTINGNGNVGIGASYQGNYKLNVGGKIRANEIVVNTTGADFVFEPTYKLRSLNEVESFIKANKHLPDIAPAKEMQENGVSAGEMQTKLLQKMEELTLYVIEQSKQIETLKKENEQLKNENKSSIHFLTKEIESLKSNHPKH